MNEWTTRYAGLRLSAVCRGNGDQRHHVFRGFFQGSRASRAIEEQRGSGRGREVGALLFSFLQTRRRKVMSEKEQQNWSRKTRLFLLLWLTVWSSEIIYVGGCTFPSGQKRGFCHPFWCLCYDKNNLRWGLAIWIQWLTDKDSGGESDFQTMGRWQEAGQEGSPSEDWHYHETEKRKCMKSMG